MSASHNFSAADIVKANIKGIKRGLNICMIELESLLIKKLSHKGTGKFYVVNGIKRQASAPGEPPAPQTGALRRSVGVQGTPLENSKEVTLRMKPLKEYAVHLEYGTKYMDPRPFIAPCIKELLPSVAQIIGNQMTKATEELITRNKP